MLMLFCSLTGIMSEYISGHYIRDIKGSLRSCASRAGENLKYCMCAKRKLGRPYEFKYKFRYRSASRTIAAEVATKHYVR